MSKNRDYISEILSKRGRLLPQGHRLNQVLTRLSNLGNALNHVETKIDEDASFKLELMKYFPVGCVACLEGYFRLVYKDLINHGSPFSDNVSNYKDISFNMKSVIAIYEETVSLGEFVAHLLPLNNFDDINKSMSLIIGDDFTARLKEQIFVSSKEDAKESATPIIDNEFFLYIKKLFELRHIVCHEIGAAEDVEFISIGMCFIATQKLLIATEILMRGLISDSAT